MATNRLRGTPGWTVLIVTTVLVIILCAAVKFLGISSYDPAAEDSSHQAIEMSMQEGDIIVVALRKAKEKEGVFPARLTDLVPKYIEAINPPSAGSRKWVYSTTKSRSDFVLKFGFGPHIYPCHYLSSDDGFVWQ